MGGGGGTTTTTNTVNTGPWQDQQGYLNHVFQEAQKQYLKGPLQYYPDSTVAPFAPGQSQGYQQIVDKGLTGSPFMPASEQNATDTLSGKYLSPDTNPWLAQTFDAAADPVVRAFKTATAPTTDAFFAGNGAYNSSARFNAQNNNNLGLGETLAKLGTGIYGGNYQAERGNQMAMQGMVPALASARYIDPAAAADAGGAMQRQNQAELTDDISRFNFDQTSPWQTMGMYKDLINGQYGQSGTTTQQQPYYSNPMGSVLGGIMGLGSLAAQFAMPGAGGISAFRNMFSDVRLKEDIAPIGKTNDGQNLYLYRYKGDPTPHVGLMAQEVEKVRPDAVTRHPSGYKMVNYDLALLPSVFAAEAA